MDPKQALLKVLSLSAAAAALLAGTPPAVSATQADQVRTAELAAGQEQPAGSRRKLLLIPAKPSGQEGPVRNVGHSSHSSHASHASHVSGATTPDTPDIPDTPMPAPVPEPVVPTPTPPAPEPTPPTSTPPAAPTGLTAQAGTSLVYLTWDVVDGATSYNVKRSTNSDGPFVRIGTTAVATFNDSEVSGNVTYYYVVSAVNAVGEGDDSTHVGATPRAASRPQPSSAMPPVQAPVPAVVPSASDGRRLTAAALAGKSDDQLRIMRNAIYARHGYAFPGVNPKTVELRKYFQSQVWYHPDTDDVQIVYSRMSAVEHANIDLIVKIEQQRRGNSSRRTMKGM